MKEYTKKPENPSRTLESNPKASRQVPISDILQVYLDRVPGANLTQRKNTLPEFLQGEKKPFTSLNTLPVSNPNIIQGAFPDAYNQERRETQGIDQSQVQMDHMVSQDTMKKFSNTFKILERLTTDSNTKWVLIKSQLEQLRTAAKHSKGRHSLFSEEHLINIPQNIVPGLTNQVQGVGTEFDPEVEKTNSTANSDTIDTTALSKNQFQMDIIMRKLDFLIGSASDLLPRTPVDQKKGNLYNEEIDQDISDLVKQLTDCFTFINTTAEPVYDTQVWYDYQKDITSPPKKVKKRPAEWIKDASTIQIGGTPVPAFDDYEDNFHFETFAIGKNTTIEKYQSLIEVEIIIPAITWTHIYKRHYLPTFAGDRQAVNTFWKTDPHTYLTGAGKPQLIEEIQILLNRFFNFSKAINKVESGNYEDKQGSHTSNKFFFQLNADSVCEAIDEEEKVINYHVDVVIASMAPQSADIAFALKAEQLPAPPAPQEKEEDAVE